MAASSRSVAAPEKITFSGRVVIELVKAVERSGVPRAAFLSAARIEPDWLERDDVRVSQQEMLRIGHVALEITGDPALGLHWGEWLAANSFNLMSHLLVHAVNLRQAFETLRRFGPLLSDRLAFELVEDGELVELRSLDRFDAPLPLRRVTAEMLALGFLRLIQSFCGPGVRVANVCFEHPAPAYRSEYTRMFEGAERFDQPFTGLRFARALLHARSPQKDDSLYATLSDLAERRLLRMQGRAPYSMRVRHQLMQHGSPHRVAMREIARSIGVSVRSLHRRLSQEGVSYAALASEASANVAKRLLIDDARTIQETAHAMGFISISSFHRAFRRWTGTTPRALRNGSTSRRVS